MLDQRMRSLIDPPLAAAGRALAARGVTADGLTLVGFLFGAAAAASIAAGAYGTGLGLIVLNRVADGLDGAVARATRKTDRGGFLDIGLDFAFYAGLPLAFAFADPAANALAAASLLAAFVVNGITFLAFALMADRRGLTTRAQGDKSLYYVAGLAEGTETIAAFAAMCVWPNAFAWIAYAFAILCVASAAARLILGWRVLAD